MHLRSLTDSSVARSCSSLPFKFCAWLLTLFCDAGLQKFTISASYPKERIRASVMSFGSRSAGQYNCIDFSSHVSLELPVSPCTKTILPSLLGELRTCKAQREERLTYSTILLVGEWTTSTPKFHLFFACWLKALPPLLLVASRFARSLVLLLRFTIFSLNIARFHSRTRDSYARCRRRLSECSERHPFRLHTNLVAPLGA